MGAYLSKYKVDMSIKTNIILLIIILFVAGTVNFFTFYNDTFKIRVTNLSAECDAYSGWDYYTATLEITNIDKSHDKNWYTTSHTTLSQYEITEGYDQIPVFYDSDYKRVEFTLPDYLPEKECKGIVQNGEWVKIAKGQTIKSAICGWIPNDTKNIIYSYHHHLSDYTDLLHLTLLTKE